jgi:type IV secretory pathway TrbF-like protein
MADNQKRCDAFMTDPAIKQLAEFRAEQKARQERGLRVEITQPKVTPIPKTRSYTVKWEERTYGPSGNLILEESARWTATLTLGAFHTKAAREALNLRVQRKEHRNLLGILVDGITWDDRPLYGQRRDTEGS